MINIQIKVEDHAIMKFIEGYDDEKMRCLVRIVRRNVYNHVKKKYWGADWE